LKLAGALWLIVPLLSASGPLVTPLTVAVKTV
jgi:hypothetical protein